MPTLTIKSTRPAAVLTAEAVLYGRIPANESARADACALLIDGDVWTVAEYVAWLNRDASGFALIGAPEWAERGIHTASALGALLDAEHERNVRKESW